MSTSLAFTGTSSVPLGMALPTPEQADTAQEGHSEFGRAARRAGCSWRHPDPVDQHSSRRESSTMRATFKRWAMAADARSVPLARRRVTSLLRLKGWNPARIDDV